MRFHTPNTTSYPRQQTDRHLQSLLANTRFLSLIAWTLCAFTCVASNVCLSEPPSYKTEATANSELPWYELTPGVFPPEDSSHAISGELIHGDHTRRDFVIRADRDDSQNRSHFDLPIAARMLPYGTIRYHGEYAALKDIPIGTHLHGEFFQGPPAESDNPISGWHNRKAKDANFTRCVRLEDDFSFHDRRGERWHVETIDAENSTVTLSLKQRETTIGDPQTFQLRSGTRFWLGDRIASIEALRPGLDILINTTWATLYGPGRIVDVWLDEQAMELARNQQRRAHFDHVRERGLPGWIDAVDNDRRIVTVTLFDNVHPELIDELKAGQSAGMAVALDTLATFDPVNDRKSGPVTLALQTAKQTGSSGRQFLIQPSLLLEGFRPERIVRVYPSGWKVIALPREEEFFGRDDL